jgi:hemerythrin superfamily protein
LEPRQLPNVPFAAAAEPLARDMQRSRHSTVGEARMARRTGKARSRATARKSQRRNGGRSTSRRAQKADAISLLKADHREVEGWFAEFEKTGSAAKKQALAEKICAALRAHTTIEEEIFYPAFLEATDEKDLHHEAEVEHDGAKKLIAEIEAAGPDDDYFDAKVSVLSEMIKHHVKEEEQRGGMFTKARGSDMDLDELGRQLEQRKAEVMAGTDSSRSSQPSRSTPRSGPRAVLAQRRGKGRQDAWARR